MTKAPVLREGGAHTGASTNPKEEGDSIVRGQATGFRAPTLSITFRIDEPLTSYSRASEPMVAPFLSRSTIAARSSSLSRPGPGGRPGLRSGSTGLTRLPPPCHSAR